MEDLLLTVASTAAEAASSEHSESLFSALGIDWKLLIEQAVAFLILVFLLGKFVYPALMKAVDGRREQIEAGMQEAKQAEEKLAEAESKVADLLADARKEADEMLARTHQEANAVVADAEDKAKVRAEQIVADAREQLERDVRKARETLKKDTVELVARATEKVIGEKLDAQKDGKLITAALQEKA
ncbi:MAG TPA: F0F1 ATP synthase subunit B [Candidatus Saccharimonadales bacterium]|nr:F0F1 ATP synthase subunit B [Candidatus Saccharimonadales bacterium]